MQPRTKLFALCGCLSLLSFSSCTKEKNLQLESKNLQTEKSNVNAKIPVSTTTAKRPSDFGYDVQGYGVQFYSPLITTMPGDVVTYEWNFDDGSSSTEKNPAHTYKIPNVSPFENHYNVSLSVTVKDKYGKISTFTNTKIIYTFLPPTWDQNVIVTPLTISIGSFDYTYFMHELTISNFSSRYTCTEWDSDNGVKTTEENPLFIYYGPYSDVGGYYDYYPSVTLTNPTTGHQYIVKGKYTAY